MTGKVSQTIEVVQDALPSGGRPSLAGEPLTEEMQCTHYWVIEPAAHDCRSTSTGVCQKCNSTREFENFIELDSDYAHRLRLNNDYMD